MPDVAPSLKAACFGPYRLDLRTGELQKDGRRVRLQDQSFQVLAALVERPGELVTREELRQRLWSGDAFVDFDHSLNNTLNRLREVLNDSAESPRYIETIPRRGYRFIAPVEMEWDGSEKADAAPPATRIMNDTQPWPVAPAAGAETRRGARSARLGVVLGAVAVLLVAGFLGWKRFAVSPAPPATARRVMLAVLPFENMTGNPEQEYISDGLTEEMISRLGRLDNAQMGVIARTSAMTYKGNKKPVDQIGRELQVDYVLEGSLRRSGDQLRITAQLIRTSDQTHLWAQDYDRPLTDVVKVQTELAGAIAQQVQLRITPEQLGRPSRQRPVDTEAYRLHLLGRYHWNRRTPETLRKSLALYQQALERDPTFAVAYAGLADSYNSLGSYSVLPGAEAYPKAKAAAQKALDLNPLLAQAHKALAFVHEMYEWDWAAAEKEYRRSLDLDPSDSNTLHWFGDFLEEMGRPQEAFELLHRAHESDPLSLIVSMDYAGSLFSSGRREEAFQQFTKMQELDPNFAPAHAGMGWLLEKAGRCQEAIPGFQKALELSKDNLVYRASLAHAFACAGKRKEANAILGELLALSKKEYISPHSIAAIYAGLGEKDKAFEWLEKAYRERDGWLVFIKVQFLVDPLRDDPRFKALLSKMNFPETK